MRRISKLERIEMFIANQRRYPKHEYTPLCEECLNKPKTKVKFATIYHKIDGYRIYCCNECLED